MSDEELKHAIALSAVPGVGDVITKTLVSYCGGVENIFHKKKSQLQKVPGIGAVTAEAIISFRDFSAAEKEVKFLHKHGIEALFYTDENYPSALKQIDDAPSLLFYKGNCKLNAQKFIAIVGTRHATEYGKAWTEKFIEDIAPHAPVIVSGLAFGIDIAAHRAALKNNLQTIAVLGHSFNTIYPGQHRATAEKITEQGGLLTEFATFDEFRKENFPERNRIVSGMCEAVIIVESAAKGGALITAEIAAGYNKDVFAVPGRATDVFSAGCHALIKQNKAALIESAEDFVQMMSWKKEETKSEKVKQREILFELEPNEQTVVDAIRARDPMHIDELMLSLAMSSSHLASALLTLEMKGVVKGMPGKMYKLN